SRYIGFFGKRKKAMNDAWDAATKNYPVDQVKNRINELQSIIDGALQIECTCNKANIKMGFPCVCVKAGAVTQSMVNLSKYLRKLKDES
ncbi:MAG: hypothetical protein V3W20_11410, partial [Candidatus Neomarinimicrobiota bacterium]